MMELQNAEDEMYQRRKKRWLSYGRALLTLGILGLITVFLVAVTKSTSAHKGEEHQSRGVEDQLVHRSEIVESGIDDEIPVIKHHEKFKRSINESDVKHKVPKSLADDRTNDVDIDDFPKIKPSHQQDASLHPHNRHYYGEVHYFKGFKCVPHVTIRKPLKPLELKRPRERSGMLCLLL